MKYEVIYPLISFIVSLLVTACTMPLLLKFCRLKGLYDLPNERKLHHNNVPRLGGVLFVPSMLCGLCASLFFMQDNFATLTLKTSSMVLFAGFFLIYLIGVVDDLFGMRATLKFAIQFIASLFLPLCGVEINHLYGFLGIGLLPTVVSYPLTVFVSLLIVNSINLIDGIDGLASGLSIMALSLFTVLFFRLNVIGYTLLSCGFLGSVVAFFYFNMFGKAERHTKTFMGDAGSLMLGYSLAYFSIKYAMYKPELLPVRESALFVSYTLLLLPTFDLIRVALARLHRGVGLFHPDKTHIHHKVMAAGCTMRQALCVILAFYLVFCVMNYALYAAGLHVNWIFLINVLLFSGFHAFLNCRIRRKSALGAE